MSIWKPIKGFEDYEITPTGLIRNHKGKVLTPIPNKKGYLVIRLYSNGLRPCKSIHRLVAETFIPNPDNLPQVNHIDGCKTNNNVDNLEWCNNSYNMLHMYQLTHKKKGILSLEQCNSIKQEYPKSNLKDLAVKYGVSITTIWRVIRK